MSKFDHNPISDSFKLEHCDQICPNCSGFDHCGRIKLRPAEHLVYTRYPNDDCGPVVSVEKIFVKVNDGRQRRTPSDEKSLLGPYGQVN